MVAFWLAEFLSRPKTPDWAESHVCGSERPAILATAGVDCVPIPAKSPNCNPYAERVVRTVRSECLDHFVIFGERHLRHLLREFVAHYHTERYHQGIGSRLILPLPGPNADNATLGAVRCRSRLGGQLNFYLRQAA